MHHASIRTADIHRAIRFYERLGFSLEERFMTGTTIACWMTGLGGRIELIQIPQPRPPADAFGDEHYTGYYHLSFDLTEVTESLPDWLDEVSSRFPATPLVQASANANPNATATVSDSASDGEREKMAKSTEAEGLRVLLPPEQQMIGEGLYEVAFIADADGLPLEFIRVIRHG